nr:hypothetical protein [Tanacetum cinerariifolium]
KQFWTTVAVKKVNDVTKLQALVDKKKVVVTKATIRDALRLDDVEGVECLPNEEIFAELARRGYENPSTKLTVFKNFAETIRSSSVRFWVSGKTRKLAQVGDLFSHTTKYSSLALTQKVFANMRKVGKGFSGVDTPFFGGMLVAQQVDESAAELNVDDVPAAGVADEGVTEVNVDVVPAAVDEPSIPSLIPPTQPPPPSQDIPSTSQGRMIVDIDADVNVTLKDIAKDVAVDDEIEESADDDDIEPTELYEVVEVVTTAKLITKIVTTASATITRKEKEDNAMMRYQALKRKPQTEAQARKKMMIYLRNMARFKMDYFKGMKYDDIRPIFEKYFNSNVAFLEKTKEQMEEEDSRALKKISESKEDKVAKKQKLDEEVEELKRHLQIVLNDEDDAYTEATPLAHKVPVVNYEIYTKNNKPYYKIIRADGSPQLFLSFLSLLRNFDREDLEVLWN